MNTRKRICNDAIITTPAHDIQFSLSESGDRATVEAFLEFMRLQGADPLSDEHGNGRDLFCEVANDYAAHDCGYLQRDADRDICKLNSKAHGSDMDNGVYVVSDDWKIVGRECFSGYEDFPASLYERLAEINDSVRADLVIGERELESATLDFYDQLSDEEILEREGEHLSEPEEDDDRSQILSKLGDAISGIRFDDPDTGLDFMC